jgi:hypothetical protein
MILLVIIYSRTGAARFAPPLPFALSSCFVICCGAIFLLKNVVARGGKNTSNSLHRIERRRKKKIESEFSW